MKLPASVLAAICLTGVAGCETQVDFERRSAPPAPATQIAEKGKVEHVQVEVTPRFASPPPGAAPIAKPKPIRIPAKLVAKPEPKPQPKPVANVCGPCGMG